MNEWNLDPFFQYPRTNVNTSESDVAMPILYYNSSQMTAFFWVELEKAKPLTQDGLDVISFGGKALVALSFYEYIETSIGSYNEVGVAIACVPTGVKVPKYPLLSLLKNVDKSQVGFNVIDLPVTTPAACAAGREIWGYPKFVAGIDFDLTNKKFRGVVHNPDDENNIVKIEGNFGLGIPCSIIDLILYSNYQGEMLRTLVNIRAKGKVSLPGSIKVTLGDKSHPMAQRLASLALDNAKPFFLMTTPRLQLRLNSGASI